MEKGKLDRLAKELAKKNNAKPEDVKKLMIMAKKQFGLPYGEFVFRNYYQEESLEAIGDRYHRVKVSYLKKMVRLTGRSPKGEERRADLFCKAAGIRYDQYYKKQLFMLTPSGMIKKAKEKQRQRNEIMTIAKRESGWSKKKIKQHMEHVKVRFGFDESYYLIYRIWELDDEMLATYSNNIMSSALSKKYNKKTKVLADKAKFDKAYSQYIGRKFWLSETEDYDQFLEFIEGLDEIFIKPRDLQSGIGAQKIRVADYETSRQLFDYLVLLPDVLVEECVKQHPVMKEINPTSINTVRVVTIMTDGIAKPLCSFVRFGRKGQVTDNFGSGGIIAGVDVNTGKIITPAVDHLSAQHSVHPDSGAQILDLQIPHWDKVLEVAKGAMSVKETINFVGWDLAICEDKVVIIEGNSAPGLAAHQSPFAPSHDGQAYIFEPYM